MPGVKGNRNAEGHWFKQQGEEKLILVALRLPESQVRKLEKLAATGHSKSEILREAVSEYFQKRELDG